MLRFGQDQLCRKMKVLGLLMFRDKNRSYVVGATLVTWEWKEQHYFYSVDAKDTLSA